MVLVVETPGGYDAERRYVLGLVIGEWLGLEWRQEQTDRTDVRIRLDGDDSGQRVIVPEELFGTPADAWLTDRSLPVAPPASLTVDAPGSTALRAGESIPVLYGPAPGRTAPVSPDPDGATLGIDVFGSVFFQVTRYEEAVLRDRDRFDRLPAASATGGTDLIATPVADACVEVLWTALERVWPRLRRKDRGYRVLISHDVDDPLSVLGRRPSDVARQYAADLVLRRDARLAGRRALAHLVPRGDHRWDPHNTFDFLMSTSERRGLASAFYFRSHRRADVAAGALYALERPWITDLIGRVHRRGHEVGYHAGFGTYLDEERTTDEFSHLKEVAERHGVRQDTWGGRQHYLQWAPATTWRNWETAGLDYDCTVAYADAAGFRTGTSHEFPVFDLVERKPLRLREHPFQVMDVTLFGYMSLTPDQAFAVVSRTAAECRRFRGTLGLLWHNDTHIRTEREKRWYEAMIEHVTST